MSKRRMLTEEEKQHVLRTQMAIEQRAYPNHRIELTVMAETDDHGDPEWIVVREPKADWRRE